MDSDAIIGTVLAWLIIVATLGALFGCPQYNVYTNRKGGEAELARADSNRRIAVNEANAKLDSAKLLAAAEIERAKGVAQANEIIGSSLKNNEDYLRYLFINNLEHTKNQVIYIPTEAALPILEAGKR